MIRKSMTLEEQLTTAAAIRQRRQAERDRNMPRWLASGEAFRRPCGHVVMRDHGFDDEPGGPWYHACACDWASGRNPFPHRCQGLDGCA